VRRSMDDGELQVGGRPLPLLSAAGERATLSDESGHHALLKFENLRRVSLWDAGLFSFTLENSDGFLNLLSLNVNDWEKLTETVQSHGLLGQTWRKAGTFKAAKELAFVEGIIDDYAEEDNSITGCKFLYNQFQC